MMNVMLLCAGEGRRLRPFTEVLPKPAIPFLSVPLAYYSLSLLDRFPINKLVVNTHHLPNEIEKVFKQVPSQWRKLVFSSEKDQLLGSGGGIHAAKVHLAGGRNFLVLNGDEVILPHQLGILDEMLHFHQGHGGIATLLTIQNSDVGTKFGGAWTLENQTQVEMFSKTKPTNGHFQGHHFIGAMILSDKVFSYFNEHIVEENILYETLTKAMHYKEAVHVYSIHSEWFETGNPHDFLKATHFCLEQLSKNDWEEKPYWIDYLEQTIRLYGKDQYLIEQNDQCFEQLKKQIQKIRS